MRLPHHVTVISIIEQFSIILTDSEWSVHSAANLHHVIDHVITVYITLILQLII